MKLPEGYGVYVEPHFVRLYDPKNSDIAVFTDHATVEEIEAEAWKHFTSASVRKISQLKEPSRRVKDNEN